LLKRGFLGWLRGERGHCSMVRVPTIAEAARCISRSATGDRCCAIDFLGNDVPAADLRVTRYPFGGF
jgi:hypothetical protein